MVEIFDNIRQLYRFSAPCEELGSYIEFFSESSSDATRSYTGDNCFSVKMFASFTPTFWINLGSPYHLITENNKYVIPPAKDIMVVRNGIVERRNLPSDYIFTVKFFPGGLESILDISQSNMVNKVIDLHHIIPASLIAQVKKINRFENRMQLLQDFFLLSLKRKRKTDHYLQFVKDTIAWYEQGNMQFNVSELAARRFTTSKTINRYFNRVIGISPKEYFSIVRSRTSLTAWTANKKAFEPANFGYYDMSHFYKEAVKFTGTPISKLANVQIGK